MPSVTTSMRVCLPTLEPNRTRRPTVSPTCSSNVDAMRAAAARAASRRGSRTRIFLSFAHGSSSRTSGTRVVLPAPGGATRTAALLALRAATNSCNAVSMGRGVSKFFMNSMRHPRKRMIGQVQDSDRTMVAATRSPAYAGDDNFSGGPLLHTSFVGPPYTLIMKATPGNLVRSVDVAQVNQHRLRHDG